MSEQVLEKAVRKFIFLRDELRPFILENDLIDMMQMKLTPEAVDQYRESTGELPPGVAITSETFARFKK